MATYDRKERIAELKRQSAALEAELAVLLEDAAISQKLTALAKEIDAEQQAWLAEYPYPMPPWTLVNLGEAAYTKLAVDHGFLDPRIEKSRPDLDCGPFLVHIRNQRKAKQTPAPTPEGGKN